MTSNTTVSAYRRVTEGISTFFKLPLLIGTTRCDWCHEEMDSPLTMYWSYNLQVIPFRADLCSMGCMNSLTRLIRDREESGEKLSLSDLQKSLPRIEALKYPER